MPNKFELEIFRKVFNGQEEVRNGPFKGMKFDHELSRWGYDNLRYLMGSYEIFLWDQIDYVLKQNYDKILDIGCAGGYYAVGFAKFSKSQKVIGYDMDEKSLEICRINADKNRIDKDRLELKGFCSHEEINNQCQKKSFLMIDIEGAEYDLLNPGKAKALRNCDILVEIHPFTYRNLDYIIKKRFSLTHKIIRITNQYFRSLEEIIPELQNLSKEEVKYLSDSSARGLSYQEWFLMIAKDNLKQINVTKNIFGKLKNC